MRLLGLLALLIMAAGCAAQGAAPATAIPYDPNLLTVSRQGEADRWALDVAHRQFVEPYMNARCAPDGRWASMNASWAKAQGSVWDLLWKFEKLPNAPANTNFNPSDVINILIGAATKVIPILALAAPKAAPTDGLPPC